MDFRLLLYMVTSVTRVSSLCTLDNASSIYCSNHFLLSYDDYILSKITIRKNYNIILKNVLHFPKSPVKILSVASLAEQLKDDLDTWILSRRFQSIFTWDFGKYTKTILHGSSKLPEIQVKSSQ